MIGLLALGVTRGRMISSWRRRMVEKRRVKRLEDENFEKELMIPSNFRCPISLDLMRDPVTLLTGITYDRGSIERWIEAGNMTCPVTNQALTNLDPIPNHSIRQMIQDWCVENRSYGVERIPTPRVPISKTEATDLITNISIASQRQDRVASLKTVAKLRNLAKESDRNRKCIVGSGSGQVLGFAFGSFSEGPLDQNAAVLEEILSTLPLCFPLEDPAKENLSTKRSLESLLMFLKSGDLSVRKDAILVLKETLSGAGDHQSTAANTVVETDGAIEALVKLIKEPICQASTKATMVVINQLIKSKEPKILSNFLQMGLLSILVETLIDSEKSLSEKALAVLEGVCSEDEGREELCHHALAVPVVVKKILRVSDAATEAAVVVLLRLCEGENGVIMAALEVGAFQKLLLVLQVGCRSERMKEKVTKLLKMMNLYRDQVECIESEDLKDLKRPF